MAPALLAYVWALAAVPRAGWPAAFLFLVCGVMRLARFNVQRQVVDSRFFVGLAIPAGAVQIGVIVFAFPEPPTEHWQRAGLLALVVVLAFLMVSTFRYPSFKGIDLRQRRSYMTVLGIALLFFLVASHPEVDVPDGGEPLHRLGASRLGARSAAPPPGDASAGPSAGGSAGSVTVAAPVVGVGGVVVDGGRVLLIRRGKPPLLGRWMIPGGTVELGETLAEALVREMEEETGLRVEPQQVLTVAERIERDGGDVVYHFVIVDYLCAWISGDARAGSDAQAVAWAREDELPGYDLTPKALEVVLDAFRLRGARPRGPGGRRAFPPAGVWGQSPQNRNAGASRAVMRWHWRRRCSPRAFAPAYSQYSIQYTATPESETQSQSGAVSRASGRCASNRPRSPRASVTRTSGTMAAARIVWLSSSVKYDGADRTLTREAHGADLEVVGEVGDQEQRRDRAGPEHRPAMGLPPAAPDQQPARQQQAGARRVEQQR